MLFAAMIFALLYTQMFAYPIIVQVAIPCYDGVGVCVLYPRRLVALLLPPTFLCQLLIDYFD